MTSASPVAYSIDPTLLERLEKLHDDTGAASAFEAAETIRALCSAISDCTSEIERLRQPMTLMSPCERHKGMPWSTSGSSVVTGTYVMPRMVCPHCPEAPK